MSLCQLILVRFLNLEPLTLPRCRCFGQLFYFDDRASAEPIGFIDMSSATVEVSDNKLVLRFVLCLC